MKRSNRLVLLVGIFLALVAFVLILLTLQGGQTPEEEVPATTTVVVAARDLPLGSKITASSLTTKEIAIADRPVDSYVDPSFVIGRTARASVSAGQLITSAILNGGGGAVTDIEVPAGLVAMAILVDQERGVGTVVKPGDYVDVVVGITTAERVPVVEPDEVPNEDLQQWTGFDAAKYNSTTVKTLVQGVQILGTLLPPAPTEEGAAQQPQQPTEDEGAATLNLRSQIVIVAVTVQQAEVIKFAQMDGTISLVLRSLVDCRDATGAPAICPVVETTGITLRGLVDDYGVLPPQVVEVIQPDPLRR